MIMIRIEIDSIVRMYEYKSRNISILIISRIIIEIEESFTEVEVNGIFVVLFFVKRLFVFLIFLFLRRKLLVLLVLLLFLVLLILGRWLRFLMRIVSFLNIGIL